MTTIEDVMQASKDGFIITLGFGRILVTGPTNSPYEVPIYKGDNLEHALLAIAATKETT